MISRTLNIGRKRGEFERATKTMRSMQGGHRDPETYMHEIAAAAWHYNEVAEFANAQQKEGRNVKGVPKELWANAVAEAPLATLDPELLHVFLPEYRETRIRGGVVSFNFEGGMHCWCEPELFAALGDGYRLMVKFDPTEPRLGAALFSAETGPQNRDGWPVGQYLGNAEYLPDAPQLTLCDDYELEGADVKKRWAKAVRTEYRAIGTGSSTSEMRDGRGKVDSMQMRPMPATDNAEPQHDCPEQGEVARSPRAGRSRRATPRTDGRVATMTERDRERLRRRQAELESAGLL